MKFLLMVYHISFNTVGRYTNITTVFKKPDVALAVHKGYQTNNNQ